MEHVNIYAALFTRDDAEKWRKTLLTDYPPRAWGTVLHVSEGLVNGRNMFIVSGYRFAEKMGLIDQALHLFRLK